MPLCLAAELRLRAPWDEKVFLQFGHEQGEEAGKRLRAIYKLIIENSDKPTEVKLKIVNDFSNLWKSVPDIENWGVSDYWATPMEFIAKFAGDSEDFAIAKMTILELMGVPRKNLYLGYVIQKKSGIPLMILVWVSDDRSQTLILDYTDKTIKSGKERGDLQAVYLTDGEGNYIVINDNGEGRSILGEASNVRMSKLKDVIRRTRLNRDLYKEFNNGKPLFRLEQN